MRTSCEIVLSVSFLAASSTNCLIKKVAFSLKEVEQAELKERSSEEKTIKAEVKEH